MRETTKQPPARPPWLKVVATTDDNHDAVVGELAKRRLSTVCQESACPNIWECFSQKETTFLILGDVCSRACAYCRVDSGVAGPVDESEPGRIAEAAAVLGLKHVVITSVTRDDLEDGGAAAFCATVSALRRAVPQSTIEVLIPDFGGAPESLQAIAAAAPDVAGHNIETVPRLYATARPRSDYRRSLAVIESIAKSGVPAKTGLMVGLGESRAELREAMADAREAGAVFLTIGQYLAPSSAHRQVDRYYRPQEFVGLAKYGRRLGFHRVVSGPLVRSSYRGGRYPRH